MLNGETLATGARKTCGECGEEPKLQVCSSAAGYYVGTQCDCGPYSRESKYFWIIGDACEALHSGDYGR